MKKVWIAVLFAALAVMGCDDSSTPDNGTGGDGGGGMGGDGTGGMGGDGTGGMGGDGTGGMGGDGTGGMGGDGTGGTGGSVDAFYEEDFEGLDQASPTALGDADFLVFGNQFDSVSGENVNAYGPFPAPNNTGGFSGIALDQGGAEQGANVLVIISDYNNREGQDGGDLVEANTFQEWTITSDELDKTLTFSFDAKRGNIDSDNAEAIAFIKTLDQVGGGFGLIDFVTEDTTDLPSDWMRYSISLDIRADLDGQLLQVGFAATTTNDNDSGVFYDNLLVTVE